MILPWSLFTKFGPLEYTQCQKRGGSFFCNFHSSMA